MALKSVNRIEIIGYVGGEVKEIVGTQGNRGIAFSVATDLWRKDPASPDGKVIETTWHDVTAWESSSTCELALIHSGVPVHVIGRIRKTPYKREDGSTIVYSDVVASSMHVIVMGDNTPKKEIY